MNAPSIRSLTVQHVNDALRKLAQSISTVSSDTVKVRSPVDYNVLIGVPSTATPSAHTHPESDILGLVVDLANANDNGIQVQRDVIPEAENWDIASNEQLIIYGVLTIYGKLTSYGKTVIL